MNLFKQCFTRARAWLPALLAAPLAFVLVACGGGGLDPLLGTPGAAARPTVTSTSPLATAPQVTGVATGTVVSASFSKPMTPATLTPASFTLACPAGAPIGATVAYNTTTNTATLTPSAALPGNTACLATITTAAQDSTGFGLAANFVWTFVTGPPPDTTRPTIVNTSPLAGAAQVASNTLVAAVFSEDMTASTISSTSVTLINATLGTAVPGTVSYSAASRTALFTPTGATPLALNSLFTATVTNAAKDVAGNALAANFSWSFTTGPTADTTRPTVVLTGPLANAASVANNAAITATFSEGMNPDTLTGTSFTLTNTTSGTAVAGTVSYAATGRTAVFKPSTPATLPSNSQFTATVTTTARDLAGNALAANHVWSFATGPLLDTTRPTVVLTVPAANATSAATNTSVTATFSEDMNPATLNDATFTLVYTASPDVQVPGTVGYSAISRTVIFTPTATGVLPANRQFTATVTVAASDVAGNALAAPFTWTFNTTQPDTVPPAVTSTVPAMNATAVANNTAISATFSEVMNPASISVTSFTLINTTLGTAVPGTVTYSPVSRMALFTPNAPGVLVANNVYTATLTTTVADLAGNQLAASVVWTFTVAP